ncbi:2-hydroxyacid dehydrogenase [Roseomonas sp. BN140053]|uniref:2-hydroxyacid dehydrogenase n=1 Tax=Roseomonas sp. BN140053 TaxID=3391898 RepID=UPI0039E8CA07
MILLVKSGGEETVPRWRAEFLAADPRLDVRWWDDPSVRPGEVRYVVVWDPEPGRLAALPNLRVVFSSAAGVDNILRDPDWPAHLPLVRMGGEEQAQRMAEFVTWACLGLLRGARLMAANQEASRWKQFAARHTAGERRVGILGLGNLGRAAAAMLRGVSFPVAGWSRSRKVVEGVESFAGAGELDAFLARTDILVCLLPATPETAGLIDAALLAKLPRGAQLVNVGRGGHLVEADLLAALDGGHLAGALLDVFPEEPLPDSSPFWWHPKVTVTPHVASLPSLGSRARFVAAAIAAHERGAPLPNLYDPARGY